MLPPMSCTLNGTSPGNGLAKAPGPRLIGAKDALNTPTLPAPAAFAAYSRGWAPSTARPVETAPGVSAWMSALVPCPFQAEIVPLRLAKMNREAMPLTKKLGAGVLGGGIRLEIWPVGPCGPIPVVGMLMIVGLWVTPEGVTL